MRVSALYIPGTHDGYHTDLRPRWWERGSIFSAFMAQRGVYRMGPSYPIWSTALSGVILTSRSLRAWKHGTDICESYLDGLEYVDAGIEAGAICLSHGGQVGAMVAARGRLRWLVTVGTPVRKDMQDVYTAVACPWINLYSTGWENRMQLFGQLFDRSVRLKWQMPAPCTNHKREGIGHADLLRQPHQHAKIFDNVIIPFISRATGEDI